MDEGHLVPAAQGAVRRRRHQPQRQPAVPELEQRPGNAPAPERQPGAGVTRRLRPVARRRRHLGPSGRHDSGMSLGANTTPPCVGEVHAIGPADHQPSTVLANLPSGQAAAVESTTESVAGCSAATSRRACCIRPAGPGCPRATVRRRAVRPRRCTGAVRNTMCTPGRGDELGRLLQLLLDVGGIRRLQDVGPLALVLAVHHLPASGQQHDHVRLDLHGIQPLVGPWLIGSRARSAAGGAVAGGRRVSRAPMSSTSGPSTTPQPRMPLSERT